MTKGHSDDFRVALTLPSRSHHRGRSRSHGASGRRGPVATPPPQSQPAAAATPPLRPTGAGPAPPGEQPRSRHRGVTLAPRLPSVFPSAVRRLVAAPPPSFLRPGFRLSGRQPGGNCGPKPHAAPRRWPAPAPPPPRPRATRATCDLRDEGFRHERHVGGATLRPRFRRPRPYAPSSATPAAPGSSQAWPGRRRGLAKPTTTATAPAWTQGYRQPGRELPAQLTAARALPPPRPAPGRPALPAGGGRRSWGARLAPGTRDSNPGRGHGGPGRGQGGPGRFSCPFCKRESCERLTFPRAPEIPGTY